MLEKKFPQWFIDSLHLESDKEKARNNELHLNDVLEFECPNGHITKCKLSSKIKVKTMKLKSALCPVCNKVSKIENCKKTKANRRVYPQWFIDELIRDEDKERAIDGSLPSTKRVCVRCLKCGYEYETKVGNHICLKTMKQRRGCKECAREKHRQDRLNYIQDNYEKVCASNKVAVEKAKLYYKEHPEALKERGLNKSKYLKEHPEVVEEFVHRMGAWWKSHPEKAKEIKERNRTLRKEHSKGISENISKSLRRNPELLKKRAWCYRELCKTTDLRERLSEAQKKVNRENPDRAKEIGKKVSEWYKNNPEKVKEKARKLSLHLQSNPDIRKSISNKIKEHYKNKEWREKKRECLSKSLYNKRISNLTDSFKEQLSSILHPEDYSHLLSGEVNSLSPVRVKCPTCGEYSTHLLYNLCSITNNRIDTPIHCETCLHQLNSSKQEKEIRDFIHSFYDGKVEENNRDIIPPYELDLFYPEKKIAIEYHGSYWHSDIYKKKTTHYQKFFLCRKLGIRLLSVYSQDWEYKREKVDQILRDSFSKPEVIYARKCIVKEITKKERISFLSQYHFDGDYNHSKYSYGLFYKDTLLAVMSFGKLRGNNHLHKKEHYYELKRLAFKTGYKIIGGASKLLSHFIKDHHPKYLLSYSDNDYFTGDVYRTLGFTLVSYGEKSIDYQWVKYKSVLNRYTCTVETLLNKYPIYKDIKIEGSIEDFIMRDLGYNKVYRCGNSKWEWFCD